MIFKIIVFAIITTHLVLGEPYEKCTISDCSGKSGCVTIYQHRYFKGWYQCYTFKGKECVTLSDWWWRTFGPRVSSVDVHNTCVTLYMGHECNGPSIDLKPDTPNLSNLKRLGFEDKAKSVSSCKNVKNERINDDTYKKCGWSDCNGKSACATIYEDTKFGGSHQCLTFSGDECVTLSEYWRHDWPYIFPRLASVNNHETCVRFYDQLSCEGFHIEIKTGVNFQSDLGIVKWDRRALSASSCGRKATNPDKCQAFVLFSKYLQDDEVSSANQKVLDGIGEVVSIVASAVSNVIPGVDSFIDGLKFIIGFFNSEQTIEALIDAEIEKALATHAASQFSAKMHAVENRLEAAIMPGASSNDKRNDVGNAMHTCEELYKLFEDEKYPFRQDKLVSSPYLVSFSAVYLAVARLAYQMRPELRLKLRSQMAELAALNRNYRDEAVKARTEAISTAKVESNKYGMLIPETFHVGDSICHNCTYWHDKDERRTEECEEIIKRDVERKIRNFYNKVIIKLGSFPSD